MALWSWQAGEEQRDGLTVYQLQELVRTGRAAAGDLVREDDGPWRRVLDEPTLARLLSARGLDPARTRLVGGLALEVDDEGRLVPPTSEQVAQLLAASRADPLRSSAATVRKVAYVVAGLLFAGSAALFVALLAGV